MIKADRLGRMRTERSRREAILDEFDRSGLSGAKFATLVGIKYATFASWVHQRRQERSKSVDQTPAQSSHSVRWLEAVVDQARHSTAGNPGALVLRWPSGLQMEISELKQVALASAIVRALEKAC